MAGAIIIGAGPGLGRAVAHRFAREQFPVALIARTQSTVDDTADALGHSGVEVLAVTADSADESSLRAALDAAQERLGPPDVVGYNAAVVQRDAPGELSADVQLAAWAVNVVGALTTAVHVAPRMVGHGGGSIIITVATGGFESASAGFSAAGMTSLVADEGLRFSPVDLVERRPRWPAPEHVEERDAGEPAARMSVVSTPAVGCDDGQHDSAVFAEEIAV